MTVLRPWRSRPAVTVAVAATAATLATVATALIGSPTAGAAPSDPTASAGSAAASTAVSSRLCPPAAVALGFSDALDKLTYQGAELGGLSSMAYDHRSGAWVSAVDNHLSDPARIWFYRNLNDPHVVRAPLVLRRPNGVAYTGMDSDNEGLAVLPDGNFLVSSETEPSIRIFGRDGIQRATLPIPGRFAVTGTTAEGQATSNATLEGLTLAPSGREVIAAMEGALSGDVSASGDATLHRFLVYDEDRRGRWTLTKQIAYRTEPGMRVPEVAAYANGSFLVEEASFSVTTGNAVSLYAVTGLARAVDVSQIRDLALAPARVVVHKQLIANLVQCPTLGATSKETQTNPLLDNFEGMAITGRRGPDGWTGVSLISDDNFSATQTTRILNLAAKLP